MNRRRVRTLLIILIAIFVLIDMWLLYLLANKTFKKQESAGEIVGTKFEAAKESSLSKTKDLAIQNDINQLSVISETYHTNQSSYIGVENNDSYKILKADIAAKDSELKIQALGDETFVFYAVTKTSKKIFCNDATGFKGEISNIPDGETCQ